MTTTSTTSDTASFTDPIFLATFGLNRVTVLDYFLHPLNPFRTKSRCCNDILISQQISIGFIMQNGIGMRPGPLNLLQAEEEFNNALKRMRGEQYELLPTTTVAGMQQAAAAAGAAAAAAGSPTTTTTTTTVATNTNTTNTATTTTNAPHELEQIYSPLFTIRHIYRSSETKVTPLGIYYVLEGIIYKSPTARSLMKASVARTTQGLMDACDTLRQCQRYNPRTGYYWDFEETAARLHPSTTTTTMEAANNAHVNVVDHDNSDEDIENDEQTIADLLQEYKEQVNRIDEIKDNHNRGTQRSEEEEQGIRAREKINSILLGLPKLQLPS